MFDPARVQHAYDLRGRVGEDFTETDMHRLGLALAARMRQEGRRTLVVAHDGRTSSPRLAHALRAGVLAGGVDVLDLGLAPTPLAYFTEAALGADGVAVVTASHNPAAWNGLKLVLGGEVVHGPALAALVQAAQQPIPVDGPAGHLRTAEVLPAYLAQLALTPPLARPLRVALDGMHGVAGPLALEVLQTLGAKVVALRCTVDGRFPDGPPDPSQADHLRLLAQTVVGQGLDLGLALDGDGDRLVVMDGRGEMVAPDRLLVLFAHEALRQHPGGLILLDVKGSQASRRAIEAAGGVVRLSKSGHAHMRAALRRHQALLGGELSGHLFFADLGFDDGLAAAVRLLRLLTTDPPPPPRCWTPCRAPMPRRSSCFPARPIWISPPCSRCLPPTCHAPANT